MTETMSVLLDATLAATLVFIAWRCVSTRDAFGSIALFIVLGLVMAIAWVRLRAPDLALAEAALGSAITGAMLLAVWFEPRRRLPWASPSRRRRLFALLAACGAMGAVAGALLPLLGSQG